MNVVLVEPEIPQNTGNVARLCAGTGATLHLVGHLGFSLADRYLKRAGLDYWPSVKLSTWPDLEALHHHAGPESRFFYFSARSARPYTEAAYLPGDYLVFGKESVGLPPELLAVQAAAGTFRIPHADTVRSLNLSNAVAVVLYEALRQTGFASLESATTVAAGADGPATTWRIVG